MRNSQVHPDDDSVLSVITYAVAVVGVEHSAYPSSLFPSRSPCHRAEWPDPSRTPNTVLVVGHTNCGGAAACLKAVTAGTPPPEPTTPLARWLAPLTALAGALDLQGVPDSEALTKIVEASVRAQVENVVQTAPVQAAWAEGKKNLWVHGLVYELETGNLRDLNNTRGPPA
jgi:carbonic anhydrase